MSNTGHKGSLYKLPYYNLHSICFAATVIPTYLRNVIAIGFCGMNSACEVKPHGVYKIVGKDMIS